MSLTVAEVNKLKLAPVEGMLPAIAQRWSPRSFKDQAVALADLRIILEAARWSASSSNVQPWQLLVGMKGSETYDKILAALVPFNQSWAHNAGVLILGTALANDPKGNANHYALYDLGQSVAQLVIQTEALGLAAHSMGGFDHGAARAAFGLSSDHILGAVTAIGYQAEPDALTHEGLRAREVALRERKPLSEVALTALGTPLSF